MCAKNDGQDASDEQEQCKHTEYNEILKTDTSEHCRHITRDATTKLSLITIMACHGCRCVAGQQDITPYFLNWRGRRVLSPYLFEG